MYMSMEKYGTEFIDIRRMCLRTLDIIGLQGVTYLCNLFLKINILDSEL
jgi:hypothetical protein